MPCFFLQDLGVCIIPTPEKRFGVTFMFATRQIRRLAFVYAIATLFFDIILGSHAPGQTRGRVEAKTITLGIVSPVNQKEIEEHFRDFVRYVARKLSSAPAIEGRIVVTSTQSQLASLLIERTLRPPASLRRLHDMPNPPCHSSRSQSVPRSPLASDRIALWPGTCRPSWARCLSLVCPS